MNCITLPVTMAILIGAIFITTGFTTTIDGALAQLQVQYGPPQQQVQIDTSSHHSDLPTILGSLSNVGVRLTNNLVGLTTYYDITFSVATSAAIKSIQFTFPADTDVSNAALLEVDGIRTGTSSSVLGQTVTLTLDSSEQKKAGSIIRVEYSNIVNPTSTSNSYQVTVTTRDNNGAIIDGPTPTSAYTIKQIGTSEIADNAIVPSTNEKVGPITLVQPNTFTTASASCAPGDTVTGGGYLKSGPLVVLDILNVVFEGKDPQGQGWIVVVFNEHFNPLQIQASAMCVSPMP